ncbi:MAG: hypothetical protein LBT56_00310 [Prevotellaceae bacterium]|jgi:hypothetical protein|nr:hypothetical protein [Prevotellaceae bacterium]
MKKSKQILMNNKLILMILVAVLFCVSCVDENKFDVVATDDIIITNEIETTIKAIGVIYKEVESISTKIDNGQAIGVNINEDGSGWFYVFDSELLSGKIIVAYSQSINDNSKMKNVDCSKLKIRYYENTWLRLFGAFTIENRIIEETNIKNTIKTIDFGYTNDAGMLPEVTINSDYIIEYNFSQKNDYPKLIYSGTSDGHSLLLGDYKKTVTKNLEINTNTFNIVDGKIKITVNKLGENFPIEAEYTPTGRTIKYKGNEQSTYYSN